MALSGTYVPSPNDYVANQVAEYEASNGERGRFLEGRPCVILTTVGATSGNLRKTPLMRVSAGEKYAVIGSQGGAPTDPLWVKNLRANPRVELQDGHEKAEYTARELSAGQERDDWWEIACREWPAYDDYQAKTDRLIPVFVLEPAE